MKKIFCFISHTHWDREWYMSLESMMLRLCDLMDRCLLLLEKEPDYCFHLDAQTIVLEDYLTIRPSRRADLEKFIKNGQLIVGPWYLQNDFYLTSGESTVRNLLEGRRIANEFGNCDNVGYAPDQFGHISQLPQILRGFGIDNYIFGRATDKHYPDGTDFPSEFVWEGADGATLFAIHMRFWYNNAQHLSDDREKAKILVETNDKMFEGIAQTPFILMMNGVDHTEAQPDLLEILDDLAGMLPEGWEAKQYLLRDYVEQTHHYIKENNIPLETVRGEMRKGGDGEILKGTLSSRYYLKAANVKAQTMLENRLEPLYSMLELSGMKGAYSLDHFRYMWKDLMKNHPHDSSCGCSCDEVHAHMEDNYSRLESTMQDIYERGMKIAAKHLELEGRNDKNYIITLANTTQKELGGVIPVVVDIKKADDSAGFIIKDANGKKADYIVLSKRDDVRDGFSPLNLPGNFTVDRYEVLLKSDKIAPFAVSGYLVEGTDTPVEIEKAIQNTDTVLENEFLKVSVSVDGRVDLLDKNTNKLFEDVIDIEETGDRGDSYIYTPTGEAAIYGSEFDAEIEIVEKNRLRTEIHITRKMVLPKEYDFDNLKRSDETEINSVTLKLILKAGAPNLEVGFGLENKSKDHRIRLVVNTGSDSKEAFAEIPFDFVSHTDADHHQGTGSKVLPNATFAALPGMAVLTEGAHEYEHILEKGALAFTILRATGAICRGGDHMQIGGDQWSVPENQCLRKIEGRIAIHPFEGDDALAAEVHLHSVHFRAGLSMLYTSSDERSFMQGRTAVQDSRLEEYFFYPDPFEDIKLINNKSLICLENAEGLLVTALKRAEYEGNIILRAVNYTNESSTVSVETEGELYKVSMDETSECGKIDKSNIPVRRKEILTLKIEN